MSTATGQRVRVRVVALEAGGVKLERPAGPGGLPMPAYRKGEVIEVNPGEADLLVRAGLCEFADLVRLRALSEGVQIGNRCCAEGEEVEVAAHHAARHMRDGRAERAE